MRERLPLWLQLRCGVERRSLIALAVVLVVAVGFAAQHFWSGRPRSVRAPEAVGEATVPHPSPGPTVTHPGTGGAKDAAGGQTAGAGATGAPGASGSRIVVDVSGKVRSPGIHRLPAGSRVADALKAAGGVRRGVDVTGLNRARLLMDGEQVVVGVPPAPGPAGAAASGSSGGSAGPGAGAAPVSLNTATVAQLETLPGVGPVLAQHIVDYRTQHGGFRSIGELREVNGIGEQRFADLKNSVRP
ncbi:ComEA family DNA-binding protein [Streptomyces solicavernae]|uniref:ComEA family DNA-binding protein n=1 Tax=Streptomyces solicavernae TaxID=3043614 RepID=UPI0032B7B0A2